MCHLWRGDEIWKEMETKSEIFRPLQDLKRVCKVAYELEFSAELAVVHPIFNISLLEEMCRWSNLCSDIKECGGER